MKVRPSYVDEPSFQGFTLGSRVHPMLSVTAHDSNSCRASRGEHFIDNQESLKAAAAAARKGLFTACTPAKFVAALYYYLVLYYVYYTQTFTALPDSPSHNRSNQRPDQEDAMVKITFFWPFNFDFKPFKIPLRYRIVH